MPDTTPADATVTGPPAGAAVSSAPDAPARPPGGVPVPAVAVPVTPALPAPPG